MDKSISGRYFVHQNVEFYVGFLCEAVAPPDLGAFLFPFRIENRSCVEGRVRTHSHLFSCSHEKLQAAKRRRSADTD